MNLLRVALCVCVAATLWAVPAAGQGKGACLAAENRSAKDMSFQVAGWTFTWTWRAGQRRGYVTDQNAVDIQSSTGQFAVWGVNGTVLDTSNTTWTFHAEETGGPGNAGKCNGTWLMTFHN